MKKIISIIGFVMLGMGLFAQPANPSFKTASVVVSDNFYIGASPLSSLFGVVDTAIGNEATYVPYWTDNHTLGSESAFQYNSSTDILYVTNITLHAGLTNKIKFGNGTANIGGTGDSILLNGYVRASDSLYLSYALDTESDEQWVGLSRTGALFGDSIIDAGIGLIDELKPTSEVMLDTCNGEMAWYWKDNEGNLIKEYTIKGRPSKSIFKIQYSIEHIYRYINKLEQDNTRLKARVFDLESEVDAIKKTLTTLGIEIQ